MKYEIEFKPKAIKAIKDLTKLSSDIQNRIINKIELMETALIIPEHCQETRSEIRKVDFLDAFDLILVSFSIGRSY
ncbi:MAG: hypothetical protein F6K10_07650 [Moorea sp. SIO2B7]|nr:hypothetical protein [Moorena sp. SIO2B7]